MAGVTTSSTLSGQFRAFFSKQLLDKIEQKLVMSQFADKMVIPRNGGNKSIQAFRWGNPAITDVQALTEGTIPAASTSAQLSMTSITKALAQYGQRYTLTDIMKATELFSSTKEAVERAGQDLGLWSDSVIRNVAKGSNLTASNGSIGSAEEGGGSHDNSDTLIEVYGQPASVTQSYTGLNSATTTSTLDAATLLDLMTKLKTNLAPEVDGGGYVYVTHPRISRDLMRATDWLDAAKYSNVKALYKGEVGSLYGMRIVEQTNSFISLGSATAGDRFIYQTSGGGGTGTGKDIISSFALGGKALAVPQLGGDNPFSPSVAVLDKEDKSDAFNQNIVVAAKVYFAALRVNPLWYITHMAKTGHTL